MAAIIKTGVRILTPKEYFALESQITKPSLKKLVRVLLFTGMRYQEVLRLKDNPTGFDPVRKVIKVRSGKKASMYTERFVRLTVDGVNAVHDFLDDDRKDYPSSSVLMMNFVAWGRRAYLTPAPELEGEIESGANAGYKRNNVYGLSVKTFRKTWESWLAASFPDIIEWICLSQGHTSRTSMVHYLGVPFTPEERSHIHKYTYGWTL